MPNPQNLKDKGFDMHPQNINRAGRAKGNFLSRILKNVIDTDGSMLIENVEIVDPETKELTGETFSFAKIILPNTEAIVHTLLRKAIKGDTKAIEFIFDRLEGKALQPFQQISDEGPEINLEQLTVKERQQWYKLLDKALVK